MSTEFVIAMLGVVGVIATALISDRRAAKQSALDQVALLVDNLQEEVRSLRDENKSLRERVTVLEHENALLKRRVPELEFENASLRVENAKLRGKG